MWWAIAVNGDQLELANVTPLDSLRENLGQKTLDNERGKMQTTVALHPYF